MLARRTTLVVVCALLVLSALPAEPAVGARRIGRVRSWFYFLDVNLGPRMARRIQASSYDMVVIDPIVTEKNNTGYPIARLVRRLHEAPHPKLVFAYIDIGEAERWRTYWQRGWEPGDPDWIIAEDPDGWTGNFPVAFWREEWRSIWLGAGGYLQTIADAGFDGVYLDWIEAYSETRVARAARRAGIRPKAAILRWIADISSHLETLAPGSLVVGQNAIELAHADGYLETVDAVAQEQTWFEGSADNRPPGDCPLPATNSAVDSRRYVESLSEACYRLWKREPDGTLHVSSAWYLRRERIARRAGKPVFTVDYALRPSNVRLVYRRARLRGFVPFASDRWLDRWVAPR